MNSILSSFKSLIEDIDYEISILSNTSSFINSILDDINWVGFYIYKDQKLILGPFQGKVACNVINLSNGVCGKAATIKKTVIVGNVHEFPGHIACDSASNSEIVIPIIINDSLYGVLDIDSPLYNRFNSDDKALLESITLILSEKIKYILN